MKNLSLVVLTTVVCLLTACGRNNPVPAIPEKKTTFQKIVFTEPKYGSTITLISETECEIGSGHQILLAEYTRQENKLRVVERAMGAASVNYFNILPEGLRQSTTGEMYLLPEPLNKYREQVRIAQEAEAARQRAAQMEQERQRQLDEQRAEELKKQRITRRDALVQEVQQVLSKGAVFTSTYTALYIEPNLAFKVTITGDMTIQDGSYGENQNMFDPKNTTRSIGSLDRGFVVPAHWKWLGKTASLAPSSWGHDIKEHDGVFIGCISLEENGGTQPTWRLWMKYCIKDPGYQGSLVARDEGWVWDGIQFVSRSKHSIKFAKQ